MTSISSLILTEDIKTVVIDEGMDCMYGRILIAGWVQMSIKKDPDVTYDLFSFSSPKCLYMYYSDIFQSKHINILDFYTVKQNDNPINSDDLQLEKILQHAHKDSKIILDCLSSLILYTGFAKAVAFIEKLSRKVKQLICIYRRDCVWKKIPRIETLGNTYVKLEKFHGGYSSCNNYIAKLIHYKLGGLVVRNTEFVTQDSTLEIKTEQLSNELSKKPVSIPQEKVKIESSFRLEINENEKKQKEETLLPHTACITNESKIIYEPDVADDLDDEDPDEDLCI
ncbi:uncharacterized protein Elp5 [Prorops nasuta]|uniref:uncharacterized protein Elp5 n=1 Tax=Prorops nasuta TaxID=863751 RepID=UPI0034CD3568